MKICKFICDVHVNVIFLIPLLDFCVVNGFYPKFHYIELSYAIKKLTTVAIID